jgi:hypothetical protein
MEKWLEELVKEDVKIKNIRSVPFNRIANVIGVEATIRMFREMHGDFVAVGSQYLTDLQREYCRIFSLGKTERELASILRVTPTQINKLMNSTPETKSDVYIPMFPDYKEKE